MDQNTNNQIETEKNNEEDSGRDIAEREDQTESVATDDKVRIDQEDGKKQNEFNQGDDKNQRDVNIIDKIFVIISSWFKNKFNLLFLIVLGIGIIIRLNYFSMESVWNDSAVHLWYAIKVVREPSFLFSYQYLVGDYQIPQTITAIIYIFTGNILLAGKLMAFFYAILGIILCYLLGSELDDKFTGLMSSILFSINHIYLFYSIRPLGDAPLAVSAIFVIYCLVKLEKNKNMFWGFLTGCSFIIAMLHKVQAVLFIFPLIIYYVFFKRKDIIKDHAILISWILPVGLVLLGSLFAKIFFNVNLLGRIFTLFFTVRGLHYGLEATRSLELMFLPSAYWFIIIGSVLVVLFRKKRFYFSLILFIFYWLFFEINIDSTQDRYVLPLLSIGIIIAVYGIKEIIKFVILFYKVDKYKKVVAPLSMICIFVIVCLISANYYSVGLGLINTSARSYAGHAEAGEWIKENVPHNAIIFAGSPRMVRTFSEREYYSFGQLDSQILGGPIRWLRGERYQDSLFPEGQARMNFEEDVKLLSKDSDIYLELDIYEYTQPKWYYPLTIDSLYIFDALGFELVKEVWREQNTAEEGFTNLSVILIFKKDRTI